MLPHFSRCAIAAVKESPLPPLASQPHMYDTPFLRRAHGHMAINEPLKQLAVDEARQIVAPFRIIFPDNDETKLHDYEAKAQDYPVPAND